MRPDPPILVVDDEPAICWCFEEMMTADGYAVQTASTAEEGLRLARQDPPRLVVLDVRLPGMDGLTALRRFKELCPATPVIVVTAFGDLRTAIEAVRRGAAEYLAKPFGVDQARRVCHTLLRHRDTATSAEPLAAGTGTGRISQERTAELVGRSAVMQEVYRKIAMVAESDLSVLITGETGTGKELIAEAIHANSRRREKPYLPIAPVALNPTLVESELFGHVRGAFTGANENRDGLFALAEGGTILLDEIGDLSPAIQVKLLRVLEQRQYTPVGDVRPRKCDVRILAATNTDLRQSIAAGTFREDLYYRLAAVEIEAPPLRVRSEDLEMLVQHFLRLAGHPAAGAPVSAAVLEHLALRSWPGNVRELRNVVEHAAVMSRGRPIEPEHLPEPPPEVLDEGAGDGPRETSGELARLVRQWTEQAADGADEGPGDLMDRFLAQVEPALLEVVLQRTSGNRAAAAEMLGIHRGTLRQRLRRYGIDAT